MVMPLQYIAQWDLIKKSKQEKINYSNTRENSTRVDWDYKVDDLVLISDKDISRKLDCPTKGPYKIVQVFTNGTVLIQYGAVQQRINIRRCTPYFKPRLDWTSIWGACAIRDSKSSPRWIDLWALIALISFLFFLSGREFFSIVHLVLSRTTM